MQHKDFSGVGVAMVTPFSPEGKVDYPALVKLTNFLIDGGVQYLVVLGTTGETPVLSEDEKVEIVKTVCETNKGRLPVVLGAGGNNTAALIAQLGKGVAKNIDAILSVSPYYNKPTQEGIYQHFAAVAKATDKPIILYNVPGRTGSNMLPETTLRLAHDFDNIIAIKEASGNMGQVMEIVKGKPEGFQVISGDDALTLPLISCGVEGVISVIGNGMPTEFSKMVKLALNNEFAEARVLHYEMLHLIDALFAECNPAGIKEVLRQKNICGAEVRLPVLPATQQLKDRIYGLMANMQIPA